MGQVVVSGGTGFIGRALVRALVARGDSVTVVTRDKDKVASLFGNMVRATHWDAGFGVVSSLGAMDAVFHLAGSQAVGIKYNYGAKAEMIASRVMKAERLVQAMKSAKKPPSVFVCASGVGYYGAHPPGEVLDESAGPGTDFLARLCIDWETAAKDAEPLGVRVVCARMGVVIGQGGGVVREMAKPFKWFVGGPVGSGEQVVSWVHLHDAVGMLLRCMNDETISGPVNVTTPNPVTNAELAKGIGKQMHRPALFKVPASILRWKFGAEGAEPILSGQRVIPRVMQEKGYRWKYPELPGALAEALP